jgi:hypothetical protein
MSEAKNRLAPELEREVATLGRQLDRLMLSSVAAEMAGCSLRGDISKLGTRLINEVIFVGPQLDAGEAKRRLAALSKEAAAVEKRYLALRIRPDGNLLLGDRSRTISLPRSKRAILVGDFAQAMELYPKMVDRAMKRSDPKSLGAITSVDRGLFQNKSAFDALAESEADVSHVDGATYAAMLNVLGGAFAADEALKRLEGPRRRAEATLPPARENVWGSLALASAGLAMLGVTLRMAARA